jgi:hypothetical protein
MDLSKMLLSGRHVHATVDCETWLDMQITLSPTAKMCS